jgi:two-component system, OmpR family, KDP operon response regulator KdpE
MNAARPKVLVIDDEQAIRRLLRMGLSTHGYEIIEAPNGATSLQLLTQKPDFVILDLGLPDMQGLELLRMIRARNESVPIVVLSSCDDEGVKVQALDLGADDYVSKPFGIDELLARMRAALRHQLQARGERPIYRNRELSVDLVRRVVKLSDQEVKLSPKEYELLRVLVHHAGKVLTHIDGNGVTQYPIIAFVSECVPVRAPMDTKESVAPTDALVDLRVPKRLDCCGVGSSGL